jgi:integrase
MGDTLAGELERHFQRSAWQADDDLVFANPDTGNPLGRTKLTKRYKDALERAGLREIRFHDLRHTFGTTMASNGVPMKALQEWLGHRDSRTTDRYADYAPPA